MYKLRVPDHIAERIRNLHPHLKRKVKASLQTILANSFSGKPLRDELAGLRTFQVGRFRIIYSISGKKQIEIVAMGPRRLIYQETLRILKKEAR